MKTLALFLLFFMICLSSFGQKIKPAHANSKLAISSVPPPPEDPNPTAPVPKVIHRNTPPAPSIRPPVDLQRKTLAPNSEALKH